MKNPKIELLSRLLKPRRSKGYKNPILPYVKQQSADEEAKTAGNIKKGHEFEAFIVRLFNPDYFRLLEWRSDKIIDGVSPFMNRFPDLEFYYQSEREDLHFAVECKWRQHFYEDCIELPEFQLTNYRQYQKLTGIPTFIIIGIGNTPARPNAVYVVPLQEITFGKLHEVLLSRFKREVVDRDFFLNCAKQTLK